MMACPLCNSEDNFLIKRIAVEQLIIAWSQQFNINIRPEFKLNKKIQLFECQSCFLKYFKPDALTGSSNLYEQLENFEWYYMPKKWEHDTALKDLNGCGSILEVGCGSGDFLEYALSQKGLKAEGIEINNNAVNKALRHGLPVKHLSLSEAVKQFSGHYDAICSFQVLEHVPNPKDFLKWSCSLLKPGGKLILGLPNADSFLKYQFNLLDIPPHHMTRWSEKVLRYLPNLFPLKLEHIKFEPLAKYHINGYVNAYISLFKRINIIKPFCRPKMAHWLSKFIRWSNLNTLLKGQSIYVSYIRI